MAENLFCILSASAVLDCFTRKIPNVLILIGLLNGCFYQFLKNGIWGLEQATAAILMMLLIGYPVYLIHGLGAGDVKLYCVLAAYLGFQSTSKILIASFFLGASIGCINWLFQTIKNGIKRTHTICFSPAILISCVLFWEGYF